MGFGAFAFDLIFEDGRCPNCKRTVSSRNKVCPNCGYEFTKEETDSMRTTGAKSLTMNGLIGLVVFIIILCSFTFLFMRI